MHTDEYEISIAREIAVCKNIIAKIRKDLEKREAVFGVNSQEIVSFPAAAVPMKEQKKWREDVEALPVWEQRLKEYQDALAAMRISSASGKQQP